MSQVSRLLISFVGLVLFVVIVSSVAVFGHNQTSSALSATPTPTAGQQPADQSTHALYFPFIIHDIPPVAVVPIPPVPTITIPPDSDIPVARAASGRILQQTPAPGAELPPNGSIELVFTTPMNRQSVEAALQLYHHSTQTSQQQPPAGVVYASTAQNAAIAGTFAWQNPQTVTFTPNNPLERDQAYRLVLDTGASTLEGEPLLDVYEQIFRTTGYLDVSRVVPVDGSTDINPESVITVMFNRPVVPLRLSNDQTTLPHPLRFEPTIDGTGTWINTSIYVFRPAERFADQTSYRVTIDSTLVDVNGTPLRDEAASELPYTWRFTTGDSAMMEVQSITPNRDAIRVSVQPMIRIQCSQPVDPDSAKSRVTLRTSGGAIVPSTILVDGSEISVAPDEQLAFESDYQVEVAAGLVSTQYGKPLAETVRSSFQTVPLPQLLRTSPVDGDLQFDVKSDLTLVFNTPIDMKTLREHIQFTPAVLKEHIHAYEMYQGYSDNPRETVIQLQFRKQPLTDYEMTIGADVADPYGNTLGQATEVRFRTGPQPPQPPSLSILSYGSIATYSTYEPVRVLLSSVNVSQAPLRLYRLPPDTIISSPSYYWWNDEPIPPEGATLVREWQEPLSGDADTTTITPVALAGDGNTLEPGVYLLVLDKTEGNRWTRSHTLVVSPLTLTLKSSERDVLVWAHDLEQGQPVPNLELTFFDSSQQTLGSATTDSEGIARLRLDRTQNDSIVVFATNPFAAVSDSWNQGISPWEFDVPTINNLPEWTAYLYTDRAIYRPTHQVHFKGVVRVEDDVRFSLPAGDASARVTIYNSTYEQIYQQDLPLSEMGTIAGEIAIAEGAPLGRYTIEAQLRGIPNAPTFTTSFEVAEYRPPEFEVHVIPQVDEVVRGTSIRATVDAAYFFGGSVANVPVRWNVSSEPYVISPSWASRYTFRDNDDPWYCERCWWWSPPPKQSIMSGSGTTNQSGQYMIELPPTLRDSEGTPITETMRLLLKANVTGNDNQVMISETAVIQHTSNVYAGLATDSSLAKAGEEQSLNVLTITSDEQRKPNHPVDIEVYRQTWENAYIDDPLLPGYGYWSWEEKRTLVHQQSLTTNAQGEATARFTPSEGGTYRVVARVRDDAGRVAQSSLFLWVVGSDAISWRQQNNDRIDLIADKLSYRSGETAEILIPSPFTGSHWALITVERGGILHHEVQRITQNSFVYRLPINETHAPNVFVSVVLFNSPSIDGNTRKSADYKVGVISLEVEPLPQALTITLTPNAEQLEPGEAVSYDVEVRNQQGQPVAAELSLDLVDKAVLSIRPRTPDAINEAFYGLRSLGVATSSGLAISANRRMPQMKETDDMIPPPPVLSPPVEPMLPAPPETLPLAPEPAPPSADSGKGGGGQDIPIRETFADTAYWSAFVTTDANGRATTSLTLPDNITTWVMRGVAVTGDTYVGEGLVEIVATKPLLIRPVTPRFLVVEDEPQFAANISNRTNAPIEARVGLTAQGITMTSEQTKTVQIPAQGETQVTWSAVVQDVPGVDLVFRVISDQHSDASRPRLATGPGGTLPVYRYTAPEVVGTGGQLSEADARTEVIMLPPRVDTSKGELTVRLEASLAAGMRDGLSYLEHYPYECTEQTLSRFLPNVLTARALRDLNIPDAELEARLPDLVGEGIGRLALGQKSDGGWGWWRDGESNPYVSAYVVFGLLHARDAGFDVSVSMLDRGISYLQNVVQNSAYSLEVRAWVASVLALADSPDAAAMDTLYEQRGQLPYYARAMLAMGLHHTNPSDQRIQTLLADLNNAAVLSASGAHWQEAEINRWSMNTDTRSTAIILDTLIQIDPENELIPEGVRWLMVARKGGIWENTQETAWALIALTDWMAHSGELEPNYAYGVWLHDEPRIYDTMQPDDVTKPVILRVAMAELLLDVGNRLVIGRGNGTGQLYYTAHLKAFLPVEGITALDRGVSIHRRYTLASCTPTNKEPCSEISEAKLGDEIQVELSVTAPNDLYYVIIEDPLPAGAEAIAVTQSQRDSFGPIGWEMDWWWWSWQWYDRSEMRDEKVVLFADRLPRGSYVYRYTMRATLAGEFRVIPPTVNEFYFPDVYGRGDGQLFRIQPR